MTLAVSVEGLTHVYSAARRALPALPALSNVSLTVSQGEIVCLLGPNGSGKSTLFKILTTLLTPTNGSASIFGNDVVRDAQRVRADIGVVFQHPSVDRKLSPRENLHYHGRLYGMDRKELVHRTDELLARVGMATRADDLVERLSGGMQRRVELAKGLLHRPKLLLLDEPSTGLDPGARREFDDHLQLLREREGVSVLLTTHILDEADRCDRIAILDAGRVVAVGSPHELKREIGGDIIVVASSDPETICEMMVQKFGVAAQLIDGSVRVERRNGHEFIPELVRRFPDLIDSVVLSKPTLEDVFIHKTGRRFSEEHVVARGSGDGAG